MSDPSCNVSKGKYETSLGLKIVWLRETRVEIIATNYVRRFNPEMPLQATYLARSLSTSGLIPTGFEVIVCWRRCIHVPPFYVFKISLVGLLENMTSKKKKKLKTRSFITQE